MEEVVLNNYIRWKHKKTDVYSALKDIGYKKAIWVYVMVLSSLVSFVCFLMSRKNPLTYAFLLLEFLCAVVLYFNRKRAELDTDFTDIRKLDKRYLELRGWLAELGFIRKNQIKQLVRRCERILEEEDRKKESLKKMTDRVFLVFILPTAASFAVWLFHTDAMPGGNLLTSFSIALFGIGVYVLVRSLIEHMWPAMHRKNDLLRCMIKEMNGMLDRRYPIENEDLA